MWGSKKSRARFYLGNAGVSSRSSEVAEIELHRVLLTTVRLRKAREDRGDLELVDSTDLE